MFIDRTQIFLAAANPLLYEASAEAINELSSKSYSRLGELGRRGAYAENPLVAELNLAQAFVGVYDGSAGDALVLAEQQHAQTRQLPCFIYTRQSLINPPAGKRFSTPQELTRLCKQDLHSWLFSEHLPMIFGRIERGEIAREDALLLVSSVQDSTGVSSEWQNRLAAQGYHFRIPARDSWFIRAIPPGLRAFARIFLMIVAPLLLLLLAYQKLAKQENLVAINKPTPEASPPAPTPFATATLLVSTATPNLDTATPSPKEVLAPSKPTPDFSKNPRPTVKPTPPRAPTPTPPIATTPTPTTVVRLEITPRDVRFAQAGTQTITFKNTQFPQVQVNDVSFSSNTGEFTLEDGCRNRVLRQGQSCVAQISFRPPTQRGIQPRAQLVINYGDNQRQVVLSQGNSPTPSESSVLVWPEKLSFRASTQTEYVTVQNNGSANVIITRLRLKGGALFGLIKNGAKSFRTENGCVNLRVEPGASCRIGVWYTPSSSDEQRAELEITIRGEGGQSSTRLKKVALQGAKTGAQ